MPLHKTTFGAISPRQIAFRFYSDPVHDLREGDTALLFDQIENDRAHLLVHPMLIIAQAAGIVLPSGSDGTTTKSDSLNLPRPGLPILLAHAIRSLSRKRRMAVDSHAGQLWRTPADCVGTLAGQRRGGSRRWEVESLREYRRDVKERPAQFLASLVTVTRPYVSWLS